MTYAIATSRVVVFGCIAAGALSFAAGGASAAARGQTADAVKVAYDVDQDVNYLDKRGHTPLMGAARRGALEVVKFLVERGARLDATIKRENFIGQVYGTKGITWTPLTIALGFGKDDQPLFLGSERNFEVAAYLYAEMTKRGLSFEHEHAESLAMIREMAEGKPRASQAQERPAQELPVAPYEEVKSWGPGVPGAVEWEPAGADTDGQGRVYFLRRSDPAVWVLESSGKVIGSFGNALFVWAHGLHVDREGNIWATDCAIGSNPRYAGELQGLNKAAIAAGRGHQVYKFSPEGKLLMTLGKAGQPGSGPDQFHCPADVITASDGSIFVADGHGPGHPNARMLKFTKDGKFVKTWGRPGKGRGEFGAPHTLAFDSRGRLFVGDRGNGRIQIFDQDGKFLDEYRNLGSPSGIAITADDTIVVTDTGTRVVYIGDAKTGKATGILPDVWAEGVAVDDNGNIYVGEVFRHVWRKFRRARLP